MTVGRLSAALWALALGAVSLAVPVTPAAASDNGLSIRPAMGWSSWSFVRRAPDEAKVKAKGAAESNHTGFSGPGFVNYDNVAGSYVQFTVDAVQAGNAVVTLRYANGTTADRPMTITIGGTTMTRDFNGTGNGDEVFQVGEIRVRERVTVSR